MGVGALASILLMEAVVPSRLLQPKRPWSRRNAAKPCVAACVSTPAVDQGVGDGVAQKGWGLTGFGVGEEPQECRSFITPASSNFNPKNNEAIAPR